MLNTLISILKDLYTNLIIHFGFSRSRLFFLSFAKSSPGSPLGAVLGDVTDAAAARTDDVVGHVDLVLTLPGAVVGSPAIGAPRAVALP